jgi:hypothetical protein
MACWADVQARRQTPGKKCVLAGDCGSVNEGNSLYGTAHFVQGLVALKDVPRAHCNVSQLKVSVSAMRPLDVWDLYTAA